eukprot:gnl/TRDRNA2_/TRDRNA2_169252_c0_seq1.p1 gnl/TRDRNA2_/TRDRNA2_169252_c0~~gnl/TRDRNA2_/TRDRNA2_169252_c0_seq1.p1  ORF type:complete len:256 (-),score=49.68 gnl/TRDRNA2_/TRDRNA2_169252_c0_seq1:408-1175(-)
MMYRVAAIALVSLAVQTVADEHMLDDLTSRMLGSSALQNTDMDSTVLGKTSQLAVPQTRFGSVSFFPRASSRTPAVLIPVAAFHRQIEMGPQTRDPTKQKVAQTYGKLEALTKQMRKAKAEASATPDVVPYSINMFVDGDVDSKKSVNVKYMERKIESALDNVKEDVEAVDVRLKVEGHSTLLYKMEVTVKTRLGKVVVSNPSQAKSTFTEEVDQVHDTLKRKVRQEKEKRVAKFRKERRKGEPEEAGDDEEEFA